MIISQSRGRSPGVFILLSALLALAAGCGSRKPGEGGGGPTAGKTETAFVDAAVQYGIPVRMLLAVAFKESGMNPLPGSSTYVTSENVLGISLAETAFGLSRKKIGLPEEDSSNVLEVQIDAYAKWVAEALEEKDLNLDPNSREPDELYNWIWQLAQLHRDGQNTRRNVQILFTMELMAKLNYGDFWQDPESGETINLEKESTPLSIDKFPAHIRENMRLFTGASDVYAAQYFELTWQQSNDLRNVPNHIRVIHCPFSLSACLELQNPTEEKDAIRLNAHYVIPPDKSVVQKPLQIAQHRSVLLLTDNRGEPESVQDALIVMLTGNSGSYAKGQRIRTNPKWFNPYQLQQMGTIIRNVCPRIQADINENLDISKCVSPRGDGGIRFYHQGNSEQYQWGDIPDFDESIFQAYVDTPDALGGQARFQFPDGKNVYNATQPVSFNVRFIKGTAKVVLEHMESCPDGKLIWAVKEQQLVRNTDVRGFQTTLFYKGPNGNGQHFFRTMVYDKEGNLQGWNIEDIYLRNYDDEFGPGANPKECQRNGT